MLRWARAARRRRERAVRAGGYGMINEVMVMVAKMFEKWKKVGGIEGWL